MDELLREFLTETNESLDVVDVELVRFEQEPNNAEILAQIFRLVHTIKGTCGFLGLPRLTALAHAAENLMGKFRDGAPVTSEAVTLILLSVDRIKSILDFIAANEREPDGDNADLIAVLDRFAAAIAPKAKAAPVRATLDELERAFQETPGPAAPVPGPTSALTEPEPAPKSGESEKIAQRSIRVNVDTLEDLMTMVSELVLTRNQLLEIARRREDSEFKVPLQRLSNVTASLQESVMKTRMQPIGNAWQKLPRIVRDLAGELGKDIEFEMQGVETELDRQVLDRIRDPLTHMVRNSADHGLETPAERIAAGKPEKGTVRLNACHEGGHIVIEIADDGRGLDIEKIKAKAVETGLTSQAQIDAMSETQVLKFIFTPGFSTASAVTNVSGRGVGLDVVRTHIDQLGGSIDVKSVRGAGSSFVIKIPLTLAIISSLIIEAAGERFAIPQLAVVELVRVGGNSEHRIERIKDARILRLRNKLLPLAYLRKILKTGDVPENEGGKAFVVVMQVGNRTFGIVVDSVLQTEEIVVKPMSSKLRHIGMFSGTTILGDGSVIMIIDPNGMANAVGSSIAASSLDTSKAAADEYAQSRSRVGLLLFRAGSPQLKAVPLSLVVRLEEIETDRIENADGRHLVQYRGQLMPLVPANDHVRIRGEGSQPILVFSDGGRSMGLVVDEIVDIVEDKLDIEVASNRPGILGSGVIKGEATEVIDIGHFMPLAFSDWRQRLEVRPGGGQTLLFVDDSAFFRNMLAPVLRLAGFRVTAVESAEAALSLIKSGQRFDILVTDLDMPGMSGFDLAAAIASDPNHAGISMIALSATTAPETIARVRAAQFHDCVAKFDRQGLIAALKEQSVAVNEAA